MVENEGGEEEVEQDQQVVENEGGEGEEEVEQDQQVVESAGSEEGSRERTW